MIYAGLAALVAAILFGVAFVIAARRVNFARLRPSSFLLALAMLSGLLVGISDALESLGFTSALDSLEDHLEVLLPVLLVFYFYARQNEQDRRQLEQSRSELNDSQAKYRTLVEDSNLGLLVTVDANLVYANPPALHQAGFSLDDISSRSILDFLHPDDWEPAMDYYQRAVAGQTEKEDFEYRVLDAEGKVRWVRSHSAVIDWEGREALVTFMREITAEKVAQHEADKLAAVVENSSEFIGISDLERKVIYLNPAASAMVGLPNPAAGLGRHITEFIHKDDTNELEDISRAVKRDGQWRGEGLMARFDSDAPVEVEYSVFVIKETGGERALGYASVVRDISQRNEMARQREAMERQARQSQKMEALGTLAGGVAHDFNNILAAIVGYGELAQGSLSEGRANPAQAREELGHILAAAERARHLVRQILTYSRRTESDIRALDLNQVAENTLDMLKATLPKMVDLRTELKKDLPPVAGDLGQLTQVIINLVSNAADALPSGGEVIISTRAVSVMGLTCSACGETFRGDYLELAVKDNGQGMDQQTLRHIFDPFFTTKEVGKGTGLGLATVFGIVQNHEGHVVARSAPGEGSSFRLFLKPSGPDMPLEERPVKPAPAPVDRFDPAPNILLVDDEAALRQVASMQLRSLGARVSTAANAETALEVYLAADPKPDLIILDMNMPGMGGAEFLKTVEVLSPRPKVLISTGYSDQDIPPRGQGSVAGHLFKPYTQEKLLQAVYQVLYADQNQG